MINICLLIEILIHLHFIITGRIRFICTSFLFAFYTFCLFCSSVHPLLLFCVKYSFMYHFNSIVTSFLNVTIFLGVDLEITINILIYNNTLQSNTNLVLLLCQNYIPIHFHYLPHLFCCYWHTNYMFIHCMSSNRNLQVLPSYLLN